MGAKLSGCMNALYDSKRKQFLGRDGAGWGKLGVFYFFFYLGLAGFFCAMLAVFMALSPMDRPRYFSQSSRMKTRSNPLAPGLGFRPQPEVDKNIIIVETNAPADVVNPYARSLDHYLQAYYSKKAPAAARTNNIDDDDDDEPRQRLAKQPSNFVIHYPGDCTNQSDYGYRRGRPCVLVKMNKIVGFRPRPGAQAHEKKAYQDVCEHKNNGIAVHCYGEYPADADNIGDLRYISESGQSDKCGLLETKWFPYRGKRDRQDVYQAPYVWVQFLSPKPNVLINVICRVYGANIDFDRKTGRALTRFQIYVDSTPKNSTRQADL